ncbi:MAG: methyltransferase [Prevotella sp.]|nr:methyltransferase [Prevotella sp.]
MANDYFQFRKFTVHQHRCAMKVGTDGTLLGAWAEAPVIPCRILDIGTGTGLIALMMAQRFPMAHIVGIDIDGDAVSQARENVMESPFSNRINILQTDAAMLQDTDGFDAIVSNPPYFADSLTSPNAQRTTARHGVSLSFEALCASAFRLLKNNGLFSVVVPSDGRSRLEAAARLEGFFLSRVCLVRTTPQKPPKRQLIEFRTQPVNELDITEGVIEISPNARSPWYQQLTQTFYLR